MDRTRVDDMFRTPRPGPGYSEDDRVGDLKLFEPKTTCPLIAVRDREKR